MTEVNWRTLLSGLQFIGALNYSFHFLERNPMYYLEKSFKKPSWEFISHRMPLKFDKSTLLCKCPERKSDNLTRESIY